MKSIKFIILIILITSISFLICIIDNTNIQGEKKHITFQNAKDLLSAYYIKPKNKKPKGVVIFVHGDGEINYDAYGYYNLIWQKILDSGYAVFSWDKPGIGDSSGNWLKQSMKDRQNEVKTAISFLKSKFDYKSGQIGLMGFSQAGWVIPNVAKNNPDVDFIIGVGFAIDWLEQSWYMTKVRLKKENATEDKIKFYYNKHLEEIEFWKNNPSYKNYKTHFAKYNGEISKKRFDFAKKNTFANSKKDFKEITQKTLLFLGEKDQNVDIKNTQKVLKQIFKNKKNLQIQIIPNATHGLLKYPEFNTQSYGICFFLKLLYEGENAYAKPFLNTLSKWLNTYSP